MNAFDFPLRRSPLTSCAAVALLVAACSSDKPAPRTPSGVTVGAVAADTRAPSESADDGSTTVQLSEALRSRCQVPATAEEAPRFEYDQATLRPRGENILDHVAECLKTGALKDQTITIIGHADPRGPDAYNKELGESRASAARNYLVQRGVPAQQIRLLSRGEQEARGSNEATWALDRRVDLELGDMSASTAASSRAATDATAEPAGTGSSSPILEGTRMQVETSEARQDPHPNAASYADTAEGAKPSAGSTSSGSAGSGKASASGSVNVQTGASSR